MPHIETDSKDSKIISELFTLLQLHCRPYIPLIFLINYLRSVK